MNLHSDLVVLTKVITVAIAVGLDVLAVSVGIGIARLAWDASVRVGVAFAGSEIIMQVLGYGIGTGAGKMIGEVASYAGFVLLALVGFFMVRGSLRGDVEDKFDATRGAGLLVTSLSISLDSLGVGFALPGVSIPLIPLLITISISTTVFTFVGLEFGARLGQRYEKGAERAAGIILIVLAILFTVEHMVLPPASSHAQMIPDLQPAATGKIVAFHPLASGGLNLQQPQLSAPALHGERALQIDYCSRRMGYFS
jgi:putative Mn2+ efflux pump MntP